MKDAKSFFQKLRDNLIRLQSSNGHVVVADGQRIGPGVTSNKNLIKYTTVSKNEKEAKIQEKYEQSVTGALFGDISESEVDQIADKYINGLIDELFEG